MGTLRCNFTIDSAPAPLVAGGAGNNAFHGLANTTASGLMQLSLSGACFILDGAPAITFAGLPSGFSLTGTYAIICAGNPFAGFPPSATVARCFTSDGGSVSAEYGVFGPFAITNPGGGVHDSFLTISGIPIVNVNSLLDLLNVTITLGNIGLSRFADVVFLSGNFTIFSSSITITPNPAVNGNTISVAAGGDLDQITKITIKDNNNDDVQVIEDEDFTEFTVFLIRFILDISPNISGTYTLYGTTFSGSVLLGTIEIFVEDGSGIYRIVTNKRNDTVYIASSESPSTVDVKIPNPFGKTGFIGG